MSFGRNPHVARAEQEQQKALGARDAKAAALAWREAARQWDRAAARETDPTRRDEHTAKAEAARIKADGVGDGEIAPEPRTPRKLLN